MTEDASSLLLDRFPLLYSKDFVFECSDGWFNLIYNLSERLNDYCKINHYKVPNVEQVKEKFGTLRYYINSGNDEIYSIIEEYQLKSSKICEYCGDVGRLLKINNWYITLCKTCVIKAI